ncbi:MAG: hypothetical protein Q8N01_05380 [Sulfuricurvum sp.]|nr:hypothetical protein [Sulfuricurvum sp.]
MLKKLLIALALLTASANANFFEALKDAAEKVIEEQNRLNNTGDGNSPVASDQTITPQFNSLAEEVAYKKKQTMLAEQERILENKQYEEKEKNRQERFKAKENAILEKYFIKYTDSLDMIESKFKNRTKLFADMSKDYKELEALNENNKDVRFIDVPEDIYLNKIGRHSSYHGLCEYFSSLLQCQDETCTKETYEDYVQYLKVSYETYDAWQAEKKRKDEDVVRRLREQKEHNAKADQFQKNQKIKLANEQKERQKVQGACQAWRAKANKQVYSLGIGDRVVGKGTGYYVIQGVNANTFLVNTFGGTGYLKKSDSVPYDSLKTAPSEYCYR